MKEILSTLVITLVCVSLVLFVSGEVAYGIVTWIWGIRFILNTTARKFALIDTLMLLMYPIFWILLASGQSGLVPYTGMAIYLVIGLSMAISAIFGVPPYIDFGSANRRAAPSGKAARIIRLRPAFIAITMFTSFVLSLRLFPKPEYIWGPIVVAVGGSFIVNTILRRFQGRSA